MMLRYVYTVVKTNSKYKEDDFSDSNADVNSLNVCVYTGSKHTTCVKSPLTLAPALPGSQPYTLKTSTTPPWLLCDDDSDTELTAEDTAYT